MARRVLVTPRSITAAGLQASPELAPLTQAGYEVVMGPPGRLPDAPFLHAAPRDVVGWLAGVERIDADLLELFDDLVVISRNGSGADAIDVPAAQSRGVVVRTARGANARGVAELALAHILNALRGLSDSNSALKEGRWERTLGREMPDVCVGVVGLGSIGGLVASMCSALGADVVAFDPYADQASSHVELVDLETLLNRADVVSLHAPAPEDGRPLLNRTRLRSLRPGAVLVNTARSGLVDPEAVRDALRLGEVATYCVDAFDQEPPELTDLLTHPRVVLSAHIGGYTSASVRRATQQAVANLLDSLPSA